MTKFLKLFLSISLLLTIASTASGKTLDAKLLYVSDGDTIKVRINGKEEFVRLLGIDAPEISHENYPGQSPWGENSKRYLKTLLKRERLILEFDKEERDKYERLLAYVYSGNIFINEEMVRSGNALSYSIPPNIKHREKLKEAEKLAKRAGVGIWNPENPMTETPSEFRKRTKRHEGLFSSIWGFIKEKTKKFVKDSVKKSNSEGSLVIGNKNSKVYHLPGGKFHGKVKEENREYFKTEEEAKKAGYRKAKE